MRAVAQLPSISMYAMNRYCSAPRRIFVFEARAGGAHYLVPETPNQGPKRFGGDTETGAKQVQPLMLSGAVFAVTCFARHLAKHKLAVEEETCGPIKAARQCPMQDA